MKLKREWKRMRFFGIGHVWVALLVLVAASFVGCGATEAGPRTLPSSTSTPARELRIPLTMRGDHLFVPVAMNGEAAGLFLLDTGAGTSGVSKMLAEFRGLERRGGGTAIGVGGVEAFEFFHPRTLSVGGAAMPATPLAGLDFKAFSVSSGFSTNGIIGFPAIDDRPFTIDQAGGVLVLHDRATFAPPADVETHPLRRVHGLPALEAEIEGGGKVWLIVDTGMDGELTLPTVVFERWRDVVSAPLASRSRSTGLGGEVASFQTWLKGLSMCGVTLRQTPVSFEPPPLGLDVEPPIGRIGNRLLRHFELTIDAPRGVVYTRFRPLG